MEIPGVSYSAYSSNRTTRKKALGLYLAVFSYPGKGLPARIRIASFRRDEVAVIARCKAACWPFGCVHGSHLADVRFQLCHLV